MNILSHGLPLGWQCCYVVQLLLGVQLVSISQNMAMFVKLLLLWFRHFFILPFISLLSLNLYTSQVQYTPQCNIYPKTIHYLGKWEMCITVDVSTTYFLCIGTSNFATWGRLPSLLWKQSPYGAWRKIACTWIKKTIKLWSFTLETKFG